MLKQMPVEVEVAGEQLRFICSALGERVLAGAGCRLIFEVSLNTSYQGRYYVILRVSDSPMC